MVWDIWKVAWPGKVVDRLRFPRGGELDLILGKRNLFSRTAIGMLRQV